MASAPRRDPRGLADADFDEHGRCGVINDLA
jgi:hypothetical protein